MIRWIMAALLWNDIYDAIDSARHYNKLGVVCAKRSAEQGDDWMVAARRHWAEARKIMWEARGMAGRPRKGLPSGRSLRQRFGDRQPE